MIAQHIRWLLGLMLVLAMSGLLGACNHATTGQGSRPATQPPAQSNY
jgi:hypothetical protein